MSEPHAQALAHIRRSYLRCLQAFGLGLPILTNTVLIHKLLLYFKVGPWAVGGGQSKERNRLYI